MAHPYAHKTQGGACAAKRYADGGVVKEFPISLKEADANRMRGAAQEKQISAVAKKYGMSNPQSSFGRTSAPVLRLPGVPEKRGGRV